MAKYITWDGMTYGAIIFDESTEHARMAINLGIQRSKLVGAGFCEISEGSIYCYGESISLDIKCNEKDVYIVNKIFGIKTNVR